MSFDLNEEKLKLVNLVCASLFAEPRFNNSSDPRAQWISTLVYRVAEKDPEFILKIALYVRDDLNIRSTANYMLALAANIPECGPFFKKYFHKAVRLPSDWLDVAALYQLLPDRNLKGRALPTALRKAMASKFIQFDAYQLAKYNKQNSMKRKRKKAKELAEKNAKEGKPAPPIPQKQLTIKQIIRQLHISQPVPHVMCILGKKYPMDAIAFRDSGLAGNFDETKAGTRMKLPIPETWETMISAKGNKAHVWEELIDNRKLPFMAMLRNLRNLILTGISPRHHRWVQSRLKDERTVANSRQFPFSFFTAYEAIDINIDELKKEIEEAKNPAAAAPVRGGRSQRGGSAAAGQVRRKKKVIIPANMPTPELIKQYKDALDTAVKFATVHNVKPIRGSTIVFCSVSDSMCSQALSGRSVGRVKSLVEVGVLLGLMCKYMCEECDFRIVASPKGSGPSHASVELTDGTILDNMSVVMQSANQLGKGFDFPYEYLEGLIQTRKKIDNIIVLSDETIATGHNEMITSSGPGSSGITGILKKYRQELNPDLLYVNVNLKGAKKIVDDSQSSVKQHPNDILVSGFSDAILKYVAERGDGNQLEYIQHIDEAKNLDALTSKLELRFNKSKFESVSSSFWSFVDSVQQCKWEGCSKKIKKENLSKHMKECDFRIISCDIDKCGESFPANQKEIHKSKCFYNIIADKQKKQWRDVRVFVSSTFMDMHGERDVLSRYVFPEIKAYCTKKHINFFYVDLRWGITEDESNNGCTVDVCLDEVDRCRPFFIGLLGERYGWVPNQLNSNDPRFSWISEYNGRSVTELEILSGALNNPLDFGSCVFIRDSSLLSKQIPDEYRDSFFTPSQEHKQLLDNLKQRVQSETKSFIYPASWGGVVDDKPMCSSLEKFRSLVTNQLKQDIDRMFPDDIMENGSDVNELLIEANLHEQFLENRSRRFVGRKDLLNDLFKYADSKSTSGYSPIIIHGHPGFGKSALTARFARIYAEQRPGAFVLSHFVDASSNSSDIRFTLWRLCYELKNQYQIKEEVPETYKELKQCFPRFLEQAAFGRPCIIIIDSLQQFKNDSNRPQSMEWLQSTSPVKIICSTYTNSPSYDVLKYRQPELPFLEVTELPESDRKDLIRITLSEYRKKLEESPTNNQMRMVIRKSESSKPLWLVTACEELCLFGIYEKLSEEIKRIPPNVSNLYNYVLQRLENDFGVDIISDLLCLISCSRNGLTELEILTLLAPENKSFLPQAKWAEIHRGLHKFLRTIGYGENQSFTFIHHEIENAIHKRYFRYKDKLQNTHAKLADYFFAYADPNEDGSFKTNNLRAISELPYHLLQSHQKDKLEQVLCSIQFMKCKIHMGMVYELANDLNEAVKSTSEENSSFFSISISDNEENEKLTPLEEVQRFINSNSFILSHSPNLLFQQAINQPDSSIVSKSIHEILSSSSSSSANDVLLPKIWFKWLNKPQEHDACKLTLSGNAEAILACSFSPDGKSMVCASRDRSLKIYDVHSGTEKASLIGHTNWVVDCNYSNDGSTIVSASWDQSVRLWDAYLGSLITCFQGHTRRVSAACFSNECNKYILSGSWDCTMKLWDATGDQKTPLKDFKGHNKPISAVAFSPDDQFVVSASWDCTVRVWDIKTAKCISILNGHTLSVRSVAFSPNGREIVSTSSDCTIRIWHIKRQCEIALFAGHNKPVNSCAFSSDGKHLISASEDQTIKVWDALGGTEIRKLKSINEDSHGNGIAISHDAKRIATANSDCSVSIWNALSGSEIFNFKNHTRSVVHVAISNDGSRIASGGEDSLIFIWDLHSGDLISTLQGHEDVVNHITFHPNDSNRLLSASSDFMMFEWDISNASITKRFIGHSAGVMCCDYSPTKRRVLSSSKDGTLRLWDSESCDVKQVLRGHLDWITKCCFSPNGARIATVSWDFNAIIWEAKTGQQLHTLSGHSGAVGGVAWSADSKFIVTSAFDSSLKLWNTVEGVLVTTMEGHSGRVNHCSWSGNGQSIVSCGDDGTIRVWDAEAGAEITTFQGHSDAISSIAVSNDKSHVISASEDCTVKVWDTKQTKNENTLHADLISDCIYSTDGNVLITSSRDSFVKIVDISSSSVVSEFLIADEKLNSVTFTENDNRTLFTAGDSGKIYSIDLDSNKTKFNWKAHSNPITCLASSGSSIISSSWDNSICVWNSRGNKERQLSGHTDWVNHIDASGNKLLSASHDHSVRIWDVKNGSSSILGNHNNWVLSCSWSACGNKAVSACFDSTLKLWDVNRKQCISTLNDCHHKRVNDCLFSNDGNFIISTSHDRSVCVFDIRSSEIVTTFAIKGYGSALARNRKNISVADTLGNVYSLELMQS